MERIIIATSPRTGSNLLLYSLESHPNAISGGEWFSEVNRPHIAQSFANKIFRPEECNLLKLLSYDSYHAEFGSLLGSGVVVFLYRKDHAAQLASWKRACDTGVWSEREPMDNLQPVPFPPNAERIIDDADSLFSSIATHVIAYEDLLTRWDDWIARILNSAGWPLQTLPMAIQKQL